MLFINREQYSWDAHLFGDKKEKDGHSHWDRRHRLNEGWTSKYEKFSNLPKMYGKSFESCIIADKRLVGYLSCPYWAFSVENPIPADYSLAQFVIHYVDKEVDVPFETWLAQNPLIKRSRYRTHMALFYTYDGELWLAYLCEGRLRWELIDKSCFINEGFVTTVEEAMEKQKAAMEDQVAKMQKLHDTIRGKPWDLAKTFDNNALLSFARSS